MPKKPLKPPSFLLFKAFVRTFSVDNLFNERNMQNYGFAFSIAPLLRWIHRKNEVYRKALLRHFEYFRTNNFFFPSILGATIKLELAGKHKQISMLKSDMMASIAALGDDLIYATIQPLIIGVVVSTQVLASEPYIYIPIILAAYMIFNFFTRAKLFNTGFREGINMMLYIINQNLNTLIVALKATTVVFFGGLLVFFMGQNTANIADVYHLDKTGDSRLYYTNISIGSALVVLFFFLIYVMQRKTKPVYTFYVINIVLLLVYFISTTTGALE